ncbi:M56 family metallopeptidase [Chryseobacterium sp. MFBS3-17]|uniref:M56 family metallopeptidase n=1 Tax=Chryseobacterium sp. MFBS3-17 TaxID=2886689 RepID=UPI001D0F254D|nr:M56 family metallopeptidase [Chryseobacterium sp. MFBS3-17]MCC2590014.1 hypothetical protein [Chryseobacterium sp. MFBS3-17]
METLLLYFGKMMLCSAVLFAYYHLVLKDKTFHHYNRFYLLVAVAVSLLLPLLKVSYFTVEVNHDMYLLLNKLQYSHNANPESHDNLYFRLIILTAGVVALVLCGKLIAGLLRIQHFSRKFPKEQVKGISFYHTSLREAPFSFFSKLFWRDTILLDSDLGQQILKHEMVHIEQKHSIDKVLMETLTAILWFNPVFWLMKKELYLIHEYLADKKAVKHMDTKAFAQMLLASHFSGSVIPATSPFLNSNLKKRLKMLQKPHTRFGYVPRIMALPLLFTVAFAYMVNAENREILATNDAITEAVSVLKTDTLKPKSKADQTLQKNQEKLKKASEKVQKDLERITVLSESAKTKTDELKKIEQEKGSESAAYSEKVKEIEALSNRIDQLYHADDFRKNREELRRNAKDLRLMFRGPDMAGIRMDSLDFGKMPHGFDAEEFKERILKNTQNLQELSERLNAEDWQKFRKEFQNFPKIQISGVDLSATQAERAARNAERAAKTAEAAKRDMQKASGTARKVARERMKIAEQRAKIATEQAELMKKQAELRRKELELLRKNAPAVPSVRVVTPAKGKSFSYSTNSVFLPESLETIGSVLSGVENAEKEGRTHLMSDGLIVFLDGKQVPYNDLKDLSATKIKSIKILKNNSENIMRIETRD